jgi:amino acid permease
MTALDIYISISTILVIFSASFAVLFILEYMSHTERHSTSIVYKDKFRAFSGALLGVVFGACIINVGMNNSFSRDWSNVPTYIIYFSIGLNLIIYLIAVIISKSSVEISNVNTRLTNELNRIRNINVENSMSIYSLYGQEFDRTMRSELSYQSKRRGLIIPDNLFNGKFEPEEKQDEYN